MAFENLPLILQNQYIQAAVILFLVLLVSQIFVWFYGNIIRKLTKKTKTDLDDRIIEKTKRPLYFLIFIIGLRLVLLPFEIDESIFGAINDIFYTLYIAIGAFIAIIIVDTMIRVWGKTFAHRTKSHLDDAMLPLFHRFSRIFIAIIAFLMILDVWGVNITGLLAGLGIAGIAIGFALQDSLGNIFGGISLILDRAIKVGDIIKLENGITGEVMDVGLRSTRIKTFSNELIIVPNGQLANSKIQNFKLPDLSLRVDVLFGVEYGSDIDKVKKVVKETVSKVKDVMKEPEPKILFMEMSDFSLNFKVLFWVDDLSKKWDTHQEVITSIYNRLKKEKIGIPFPTRTVYMKKD